MAKKELNFGKLSLPTKAVIIKKEEDAAPMIEQAIEKIHGEKIVPTTTTEPVVAAAPTVAKVEEPVADFSKKTVAKKAEVIEFEEMTPVKKISMDLPLDVYKYVFHYFFVFRATKLTLPFQFRNEKQRFF